MRNNILKTCMKIERKKSLSVRNYYLFLYELHRSPIANRERLTSLTAVTESW